MAAKKIIEPIVRPTTKAQGEKHILERLFDGPADKLPIIKAVGYQKFGPGNTWCSYVITTRGREVLSIDVEEPNLRGIAEESAKISFVTNFIDQEIV